MPDLNDPSEAERAYLGAKELKRDEPQLTKDERDAQMRAMEALLKKAEAGATWYKPKAERLFRNYRGRRLIACRAADDLKAVIENLGVEDGSELPIPDQAFKPAPSKQVVAELQNMAASLLRMILILNDGQVSSSKLESF